MVAIGHRAGVVSLAPGPGFAPPTGRHIGNQVPPGTGLWPSTEYGEKDKPGPGPDSPGYVIGGTAGGGNDGLWGAEPRAPMLPRNPRLVAPVIEGQASDGGEGPPLGYDEGVRANPAGRGGFSQDPLPHGRQSYWRGGIQGFSDKLTVKDRHAFWDAGNQRTGITFAPASANPNTYNDPVQRPPRPALRVINRTVSYQKGTDVTRNADDLTRPYTWVGEQGSGYSPVYGGTPGLYQPYGTRGGVPYPIIDPTAGEGGRETVWAGPPHGLHSATFPSVLDTLRRTQQLPQMRPVRVDRPSNSPQAGQALSKVVQRQGGPPRSPFTGVGEGNAVARNPVAAVTGRGWTGQEPWS